MSAAPSLRGAGGRRGMGRAGISRLERFGRVDSTQLVVRAWLAAGAPEVCVAVADEQRAGRGRLDRSWQAGPGQALLVSAGFRPVGLSPTHGWRLPAVVALAMLEATRELLPSAVQLGLKWPNDLVSVRDGRLRKVGGVLAEAVLAERGVDAAVVGVGVNVDWPARHFPPQLADTMSSLQVESGGAVDRDVLLGGWIDRLLPAYADLCNGRFDGRSWAAAQVVTGAALLVDTVGEEVAGVGEGVDPDSGDLLLRTSAGGVRRIAVGEVLRCQVGRLPSGL